MLSPLYEETQLSASSADSTLQIVKEQQPTLSSLLTDKPQHPLSPSRNGCLGLSTTAQSNWWRMTGSNRRPPACKAGALPAELIPRDLFKSVVGLAGFEPATPALSRRCSNQLSYRPTRLLRAPVPLAYLPRPSAKLTLLLWCCIHSR